MFLTPSLIWNFVVVVAITIFLEEDIFTQFPKLFLDERGR